ncbi:MAG: M42 family peptidase [Oscillospiraceae bacterium]|nr:M42 family peptidase [Oscillospiraceae bacterium]
MDLKLLETLCNLNGIPGDEGEVSDYIISQIEDCCESWQLSPLGSLIVFKKGRAPAAKKILFSAHMDEVGLMVSHITDEGLLKVVQAGGIDDRVLLGRQVAVGKSRIPGVIGTKAIHQQTSEERETAVKTDKMFVDIGCTSREEAAALVTPGDSVCFVSDFERLGDSKVKGKAIDDRFGCAVMIDMIKSELPYDCWFCFTSQEEVGLRGAQSAGYIVNPDIAVILETTTSGDLPGVSAPDDCCRLGKGAVVPFMDRATIYPRELYKRTRALADRLGIPTQTKTLVAGGNDAGAYQKLRGGAACINISAACRCLHSPCVIADLGDIDAVEKLAFALVEELGK